MKHCQAIGEEFDISREHRLAVLNRVAVIQSHDVFEFLQWSVARKRHGQLGFQEVLPVGQYGWWHRNVHNERLVEGAFRMLTLLRPPLLKTDLLERDEEPHLLIPSVVGL